MGDKTRIQDDGDNGSGAPGKWSTFNPDRRRGDPLGILGAAPGRPLSEALLRRSLSGRAALGASHRLGRPGRRDWPRGRAYGAPMGREYPGRMSGRWSSILLQVLGRLEPGSPIRQQDQKQDRAPVRDVDGQRKTGGSGWRDGSANSGKASPDGSFLTFEARNLTDRATLYRKGGTKTDGKAYEGRARLFFLRL